MKKTRGRKSRATVPLSNHVQYKYCKTAEEIQQKKSTKDF
jgi:hypothetical protein